jgi:glutamine---fructose-6-phosphate transaminase (isomerizing)
MDYYEAVAAQPARLEASAQAVDAALAALDLKPWRQGQLGIVSMGASSHAANALVHRLARKGRRAVNIDASDVLDLGGSGGAADCYLLVTEGGRSRETIEAARLLAPAPRLALTNAPDAPIAEVVDAVVGLGHGPDSKVYTVGYTAALQAFGLLADALGAPDPEARAGWAALPGQVATTLDRLAPAAAAAAQLLGPVGSIDFVGSGASRASVAEAALLFRESTRTTTAAFDTYQYLHGPMECLTPQHGVLLFGGDREVELAHYLAGRGIPTALVTSTTTGASGSAGPDQPVLLEIPAAPEGPLGVLQILPPQLVAGLLARERGLGIDGFLYHQDDTKIGQPALG